MTETVESLNARVSLAVNGRTLSDLLAQQKRLAFSTVVDYLDQLSEAIDLAHEQGFIHRNIKPSGILLTTEGQVVLPDLRSGGGRRDPRSRSYRREARWASYEDTRLITLAYMAPEQILEGDILSPEARRVSNIAGMERAVDGRADLYALGVVLYQMVTGVLPFQAETPEQMALMHLRMPPSSPRQLRPDLPIAAEQAMLRALAKRPTDRYVRAQDLATAFRVTLIAADILRIEPADAKRSHDSGVSEEIPQTSRSHFKVRLDDYPYVGTESFPEEELFDPALPAEIVPVVDEDVDEGQPTIPIPVVNAASASLTDDATTRSFQPANCGLHRPPDAAAVGAPAPLQAAFQESHPISPLSPVAQEAFPTESVSLATHETFSPSPVGARFIAPPEPPSPSVPIPTNTGVQPTVAPPDQRSTAERISINPISPLPATSTTGMLALSNFQQGNTGTLKLTGPAKIVQVPVAGQPGLYVTGLLPVFPQQPSLSKALASTALAQGGRNKGRIILTLAVVVMLVVFGSSLFWFTHTHSSQTNKPNTATVTPNLKAIATARAIATANANVILIDPLSQNIHNWPITTTGSMIFIFKDGAYHITDNNPTEGAPAILPDEILHGPFAYTLTMQEIRGNDASINNEFGMIIRANSQNKYGKIITTFYSFEVLNTKSGEYQFWKYDNSKAPSVTPWTKLWHQSFGKEFHQGQGPRSSNTFKIFVNGKSFTLIVNGKQIATVQDNSCTAALCSAGAVGMLVNLKGTEVAFSNLKLTYS